MLILTAAGTRGRGRVQHAISLPVGCHRLSQRARGWLASNKALLFLICVLLFPSRALLHLSTQTPHHLRSLNPQPRWKDRAFPSAALLTRKRRNHPRGTATGPLACDFRARRRELNKDGQDSPNHHWTLSFITTPQTILRMTCTVGGYTKIPLQDMYWTTICPDFSFALWWCPGVPLHVTALLCDTLCISTVKQSPCPKEFEVWRGKSVMIKHVKSNHHPASPHVPLLVLLSQPQKEQSLQPRTIFLWQSLACVTNAV